ncbi:uncharacterized protein [Oscarella lobularis]|uniref:uncharacterized protein n=1 Tax=Oscarella lobularis TaxID=121494 RepID=UPI00331419EE
MRGDQVYLARGIPDHVQINNESAWEFYNGTSESWTKTLDESLPLYTWLNRSGIATMKYLPVLKRYIMCITTPTVSPFSASQFGTYLLESVSMTGPFSLITYMKEFGPENILLTFQANLSIPKLKRLTASCT